MKSITKQFFLIIKENIKYLLQIQAFKSFYIICAKAPLKVFNSILNPSQILCLFALLQLDDK